MNNQLHVDYHLGLYKVSSQLNLLLRVTMYMWEGRLFFSAKIQDSNLFAQQKNCLASLRCKIYATLSITRQQGERLKV